MLFKITRHLISYWCFTLSVEFEIFSFSKLVQLVPQQITVSSLELYCFTYWDTEISYLQNIFIQQTLETWLETFTYYLLWAFLLSLLVWWFCFISFIYFYLRERVWAGERGRRRERERERERLSYTGFMLSVEPDPGLNPMTLGSGPEWKSRADAQPNEPPWRPTSMMI